MRVCWVISLWINAPCCIILYNFCLKIIARLESSFWKKPDFLHSCEHSLHLFLFSSLTHCLDCSLSVSLSLTLSSINITCLCSLSVSFSVSKAPPPLFSLSTIWNAVLSINLPCNCDTSFSVGLAVRSPYLLRLHSVSPPQSPPEAQRTPPPFPCPCHPSSLSHPSFPSSVHSSSSSRVVTQA